MEELGELNYALWQYLVFLEQSFPRHLDSDENVPYVYFLEV